MPLVDIPDESFDEESLPEDAEVRDEDELLTQDEVDSIVQKRLNRQERTLKSELKNDDEFWEEMAQSRGVELREDGKPKGSLTDEEVQELRQKASRVDELEQTVEEYESEIEGTRETKLENQLMQTAQGLREDMQDVFISYAKQRMTYTEDYGWVATDEDGEIAWEGGEPKGPEGVAAEMEEQKPSFFKESSMSEGPSGSPTDDGSSGRTWTRQEWEEAASRTGEMSDEEFQDWDSAEEEGRIQE
jgi:hypothetical protein